MSVYVTSDLHGLELVQLKNSCRKRASDQAIGFIYWEMWSTATGTAEQKYSAGFWSSQTPSLSSAITRPCSCRALSSLITSQTKAYRRSQPKNRTVK